MSELFVGQCVNPRNPNLSDTEHNWLAGFECGGLAYVEVSQVIGTNSFVV